MDINSNSFVKEVSYLTKHQVSLENLRISNRAHVILPYHIKLDKLQENEKGIYKIGTTKEGIGPAYMDKAARSGIRIADLLDKDTFYKKLMQNVREKNRLFEKIYAVEPDAVEEIFDENKDYD